MPKVSVIVVTWNAEKTIKLTIDSILAQTYTDFELLVFDNKSTDRTLEILSEYSDARLVVTKRANNTGSPVTPRNEGIALAKGEWIAFCDHDDLWEPEKLTKQLLAYEQSGEQDDIGIIYSGAKIIDATGRQVNTNPSIFSGFVPNTQARQRLLYGDFITTCSVLIKRSAVEETGTLDETLVGIDDYEYFLRVTKEYGMLALPELLCSWRNTGSNLSGDKVSQYRKDEVIFEKLEEEEPENADVKVGHGKNLTRIFLALVLRGQKSEANEAFNKIMGCPVSKKIATILWFWRLSPTMGAAAINLLDKIGLVSL